MTKKSRAEFYIDPQLKALAIRRAKLQGRSFSNYVSQAVAWFVDMETTEEEGREG